MITDSSSPAAVTITAVEQMPGDERLLGCSLDEPAVGSSWPTFAVPVSGWAVPRGSELLAVELADAGDALDSMSFNAGRPDIQALFPAAVPAHPGFRHVFNAAAAAQRFALDVSVVLPDETRVTIARLRGERRRLGTAQPGIQPLMVTTLGRTGSTWLASVLSMHDEIVAYQPFVYEPRALSYWMEVFRRLSSPRSSWQALSPREVHGLWWADGEVDPDRWSSVDPAVGLSIGDEGVEALLDFCRGRIESLYQAVSSTRGRRSPRYFLEKCVPTVFLQRTAWEVYPGAREIILIRDQRDMVCSILAYTARGGSGNFGQDGVTSPVDYVRLLAADARRMVQAWRQRGRRVHLVRYEDLVREPVSTVRGILEYLALDADTTLVQGLLEAARIANPAEQRFHQTSNDTLSSVGRWKRDMDSELRAAAEEAFGEALREFGYS